MVPFPSEIRGVQYLTPENQFLAPPNFGLQQSDDIPNLYLNSLLSTLPNCQFPSLGNEFAPPNPCLSSNSTTSDEADELQFRVIDERKHRRMISNRESARRSRMRKQKHLDELWSQVVRLRTENHNLVDRLNHVSESHDRALQENARLKEETSDLRRMVADMQIGNSFACTMRDFEEIPCNTSQLKEDSSNQSIIPSDLVHE
ncbi:basic leucine zipper 43-like [Lotus japonicus]|uniref:basic leucine zipper 43-like n=1 Tax=Lotus japonicus TaxID=34305 RepID=UPI00258EEFD0|nr:basic leucine zipper 43-like [Lotus japonicus]